MLPLTASKSHLGQLVPAKNLQEISKTLRPDPLESQEELDAFYKKEIQQLRKVDSIGQIRLELEDALANQQNFKAFVMGHLGVGKTTEIFHLLLGMQDKIQPLRLSITEELNPGTLRYYDILLLILLRLVQAAGDPTIIGFQENDLRLLLDRVRDALARRWTRHLKVESNELGAGLEFPFLKFLGNIKLGSSREQGKEEHEVAFVTELVAMLNDVIAECNRLLAKYKNGKQWLLVLDDFEKIGAAPSLIRELFISLRPIFEGLTAHLLVVIPIWLYNSEDSNIILPANFRSKPLRDIAVFDSNHVKDAEVLSALASVVTSRIDAGLFAEGVLDRCCIASGGNLRDLFTLIRDAMLSSRLRGVDVIAAEDLDEAIGSLREVYKGRLGSTGQDTNKATLEEKLTYLVSIYKRENKIVDVPNPIQYLLLAQRCVLYYNGEAWLGVHPLVIDLLIDFKKLDEGSPGGSR